jgi:hypothetical protein
VAEDKQVNPQSVEKRGIGTDIAHTIAEGVASGAVGIAVQQAYDKITAPKTNAPEKNPKKKQ